jgi:glycosyltransferase involved in cell wall biosynthesis
LQDERNAREVDATANMKIVYHHRTRSTDAQRIHITEMVKALESLGHKIDVVSLVPLNAGLDNPKRDASNASWQKIVRRLPFGYELAQFAYNFIGVPLLIWRTIRSGANLIYERYALLNFSGVIVARLRGLPLILEVNSPLALEQYRDKEIRLHRLARWAERVICRLASRVIVVSTPLGRILEENQVPSYKIEVMPNGVSLEVFKPRPASPELRQRLGLKGFTVVGFVGWFRNWHGLDLLLEAFHKSNLANHSVKLMLIGDGPAMPDLKNYVEKHQLQESVLFTGPLRHTDVPEYLDLVDIAVQPAAIEYCSPMKILEYMALGKCIVGPRQENIQELLREGEEAQLFKPWDAESMTEALTAIVLDPEKARHMGQQARQAIDKRGYLWSSNARRVTEMAEEMLKSGNRSKNHS